MFSANIGNGSRGNLAIEYRSKIYLVFQLLENIPITQGKGRVVGGNNSQSDLYSLKILKLNV